MNVALGVTGCIAAYKAVDVMRGLQKAGVSVQVVLTRAAAKFVAPLTFEALSGRRVITDMFRGGENVQIQHIAVAQQVRALAVVPATANILAKFAHGIADDFLSTLYISTPAPVLLAPAMNVEMWNHAAVQANVEVLRSRGHEFVNPEPGVLACGMEGEGRLAEVDAIVSRILNLVANSESLAGLKVLVTAGPTVEDIDPVRYLSNRSTGKMGYALAQAARARGAEVFLVSGPTHLTAPAGVRTTLVRSAGEMKEAVLKLYPEVDIVVKAAAVSDYRPADYSRRKIKKSEKATSWPLSPTDDILSLLGKFKQHQILVGFAAETENLAERARDKMTRKNLDLIVANDVSHGVFGMESATVQIFTRTGESLTLENQSKRTIAERVLDMAQAALAARKTLDVPDHPRRT
jgi:phosphopantothenoylcysteine decarboxylase / phosphopantothenate---cysteine ligase